MYRFHATVHAKPSAATLGPPLDFGERSFPTLMVDRETLGGVTFSCSFEDAQFKLTKLGRMYCEPDGSFVWVSPQNELLWQVDGNLYDRNERLLFVDIKGTCPAEEFDRLLSCFGWPETPLMFQLVHEAVFLVEAEFRRWCEGEGAVAPDRR